ncbi:hypothetical protein HKCCE4037_07330 [Rhodobacterales bacterium HKCCE4037]|nr:hypothetical protein [Rhodobacterales bacterium HKCCE4037]
MIGQVIRLETRALAISPPAPKSHGILLLVERLANPKSSLAMGGGEVRMALNGALVGLLNRSHSELHAALDRGAVIDARFRAIPDPMEAAFTCHEIVTRLGPAWA